MHIRFKKLASVLLSFAIVGGTVLTSHFSVFAHETLNQSTDNNTTSLSDSYEYKINDDGTAEITKYTGLERRDWESYKMAAEGNTDILLSVILALAASFGSISMERVIRAEKGLSLNKVFLPAFTVTS